MFEHMQSVRVSEWDFFYFFFLNSHPGAQIYQIGCFLACSDNCGAMLAGGSPPAGTDLLLKQLAVLLGRSQ